jgi:hypothetical protein
MRLLFPYRCNATAQTTILGDPCVFSNFPAQQTRAIAHIPRYQRSKHYKTFFTRITSHEIQWGVRLTEDKPEGRTKAMRDYPVTFLSFGSIEFIDLKYAICEILSPTLSGATAICDTGETCRQTCLAALKDERCSAIGRVNTVFLFDALLFGEEYPITKDMATRLDLRIRQQKRNNREFNSFLVKAVVTFSVSFNSFIIHSSIIPLLCGDIEYCCYETVIKTMNVVLCVCSFRCFL